MVDEIVEIMRGRRLVYFNRRQTLFLIPGDLLHLRLGFYCFNLLSRFDHLKFPSGGFLLLLIRFLNLWFGFAGQTDSGEFAAILDKGEVCTKFQ